MDVLVGVGLDHARQWGVTGFLTCIVKVRECSKGSRVACIWHWTGGGRFGQVHLHGVGQLSQTNELLESGDLSRRAFRDGGGLHA